MLAKVIFLCLAVSLNVTLFFSQQFLRLRFDVGAVTYEHSKGSLDIVVEATTISEETAPSNNVYRPNIPVKIEADTAMFG